MDQGCALRCRQRNWPRWIAAGLSLGVPLLPLGCGSSQLTRPGLAPTQVESITGPELPDTEISPVSFRSEAPVKPEAKAAKPTTVPITLDTVFRLAEKHNPRIGLVREKLNESMLNQVSGHMAWLPNIYAGMAYYRHEGGIQDFSGRLLHSSTGALYPSLNVQTELDLRETIFKGIDAERKVWQQKAELIQVNNEVLLDAATTYIDLLTARHGEALAFEIEKHERKLLERIEKLAKLERGTQALLESLQANSSNRALMISKLRQQGNAASAKLVYLLGLPPQTCLQPSELIVVPIELVDSTPSVCDLVEQVLATGPGIRELQGLLQVAEQALSATYDKRNFLPIVQLNVCEGPFGAGPGGSLAWDNRLDIGVQLRWNISALFQAEQQRCLIRSRQNQVMWNYQELRGKLAAGVQEARDAILHGREQLGLAKGQIQHASESYRLTNQRMEEGVPGSTPGDVLLSIRNLEQAHFNHLQSLSAHNKAQIRLRLVLGPPDKGPAPAGPVLPKPEPGVKHQP